MLSPVESRWWLRQPLEEVALQPAPPAVPGQTRLPSGRRSKHLRIARFLQGHPALPLASVAGQGLTVVRDALLLFCLGSELSTEDPSLAEPEHGWRLPGAAQRAELPRWGAVWPRASPYPGPRHPGLCPRPSHCPAVCTRHRGLLAAFRWRQPPLADAGPGLQ